jgi:hypothetical protein
VNELSNEVETWSTMPLVTPRLLRSRRSPPSTFVSKSVKVRQVTALHRRVELITYGLAPALCCTEPRFFTPRPCPIRGDMFDELGP